METAVTLQTTVKLSVREIIGTDTGFNVLAGEKVYARLREIFAQPESKVVLDFSNIRRIISAFFHLSVGRLYEHYAPEEIVRRLSFEGLAEDDLLLMKRVQKRALEYYLDKDGFIACYQKAGGE